MFPISMYAYLEKDKISNFAYKTILASKLVRLRKVVKFAKLFLRKIRFGIDMTKLTVTSCTFILTIHIIANIWASLATTTSTDTNWMKDIMYEDKSVMEQYVTALYFAVTTLITIGYGDILPVNDNERILVCFNIALGVVIFSFLLSKLANSFIMLNKSASKRQVLNMINIL